MGGESANLDTLFIFMPFCIHRSFTYKYIRLISLWFLLTVADKAVQSYFLSKTLTKEVTLFNKRHVKEGQIPSFKISVLYQSIAVWQMHTWLSNDKKTAL